MRIPKNTRFYQPFVQIPWFCEGHNEWLCHDPVPIGPPQNSSMKAGKDRDAFEEKQCGKNGPWAKGIREAKEKGTPFPVFFVKQIWPITAADQPIF